MQEVGSANRVSFLNQCSKDFLYPDMAVASLEIFLKL